MAREALYGPTEPAPRCEAHAGEHAVYQGACIAVGAQVPRPLLFSRWAWACVCGQRVSGVIDQSTMRQTLINEPSGTTHECPPALRVRLDEEALASAIVRAARASREERRQGPREGQQAPTSAPMNPMEPPEMDGLQTVAVWTDDGPA